MRPRSIAHERTAPSPEMVAEFLADLKPGLREMVGDGLLGVPRQMRIGYLANANPERDEQGDER